jgi:hypothetical protein
MTNTARLCDKCPATARYHVESLDLAFCAHHWTETAIGASLLDAGHTVIDYRESGIPDYRQAERGAKI